MGSIFQEKKEGKVRTVVLNLTQKNLSHQLSVAFIPTARKVSALCASPFGTAAQQNERFRADEGIGPYKEIPKIGRTICPPKFFLPFFDAMLQY